jgi:23S rRNA (pseudouridine1915-N3)-methyltransferase
VPSGKYTKSGPSFMKVALLQTGRTTEKYVSEGIDIFASRIRKYCQFEIHSIPELKDTRKMPVKEQKTREGKKILDSLGKDDYVVLLDEHGKELRTAEFAGWLENRLVSGGKRIVFVIGGPWGFQDEVINRADFVLSLSKMTFPHQLVRLLFIEQLYRAFTVMKGEPYHHE